MSEKEIKTAISNAEMSLIMEGFSINEHTKSLCEKLLTKEITMAEYISVVKQKAGELRKTDISKKGTSFCSVKELNDKFERYLYDPNTVECSEHIEPLCYDLTLEVTKELIDTIPTGAVVAYCSR